MKKITLLIMLSASLVYSDDRILEQYPTLRNAIDNCGFSKQKEIYEFNQYLLAHKDIQISEYEKRIEDICPGLNKVRDDQIDSITNNDLRLEIYGAIGYRLGSWGAYYRKQNPK